MQTLNPQQKKVMDFLIEEMQTGLPPTIREICAKTGIKSTSSVAMVLNQLELKGFISRDPKSSRAIRIEGQQNAAHVPLLGRVTAGLPIFAHEQVEGYIPVPAGLARNNELFALRVTGDSMINAGIFDGDIVVSEKSDTAENGEIVIALLEDEATCKRYYADKKAVRLEAENPAYKPIISPDIRILGKVVASMRFYGKM